VVPAITAVSNPKLAYPSNYIVATVQFGDVERR
jgi:hypothetical protein